MTTRHQKKATIVPELKAKSIVVKKAKKAGKTFVVHTASEDSDDCESSSVADMSAVKVQVVKNRMQSQKKYYK